MKIKVERYSKEIYSKHDYDCITVVRTCDMINYENGQVLDKEDWLLKDDTREYSVAFNYKAIEIIFCDTPEFRNKHFEKFSDNYYINLDI